MVPEYIYISLPYYETYLTLPKSPKFYISLSLCRLKHKPRAMDFNFCQLASFCSISGIEACVTSVISCSSWTSLDKLLRTDIIYKNLIRSLIKHSGTAFSLFPKSYILRENVFYFPLHHCIIGNMNFPSIYKMLPYFFARYRFQWEFWLYTGYFDWNIIKRCRFPPLKLWVRTQFMARCTRYNIMW